MVVFGGAVGAQAAPARIRFHIEPKLYSEALLDVAQQANVTLIGAGACNGYFRSRVAADMTLDQVLDQVLAGAPCTARVVAPGAVEISAVTQAETTARPAPPVIVSELVVTATKRSRNSRQLAVAITALPRDQLLATGVADAGEASGQLAGVLATNLGPGRNKLLLRALSDGAYTGRARSIVATYLDDLPVNYNAPDPDLRLVDVDRVEVARGPQGALYGAGSLSGVYRIVTRKPDPGDFSAELRTSGAITRDGGPSNTIEGYVNQPLWGVAALRLSGYNEVQGGYLDDITQHRENVDRTERRGGRLALMMLLGDDWSVNVTAAGQHLRSEDTHYTTPGLGLTRSVRIPEPHVNDIEAATVTIKGAWGWGELTSSTGYVRHAYGSLYDATATQLNYTNFAQTSAYSERTRTSMLVQDIVLTSRGAQPLEWLVGLYGSDTSVHSPNEFLAQVPRAPNILVYGDDRRDHIRELAAYGEVSYAFAPNWTLALGGRAFNIRTSTHSDVVAELYDSRSLNRGVEFTGFSPKVSVQRSFGSGDLFYAVVSEGYRSGGVNSGGAKPLPAERETYAPDRLINLETGVKLEALDKQLSLNTALFYDLWTDIQSDQFRDSGIPYTTNAGDARVLGLESELTWRGPSGLSAQVNASLSRTRTYNANPNFSSNLAQGLPGAPAVSGGALLTYERRVFGDWMLRLVGQATYVGRSRVTFDSTLPSMGGYTRSKLSAEVIGKMFGVQVYLANPFNAYSDTFAFGNPFNPDRTRQITPQRPVTLGVTLSATL